MAKTSNTLKLEPNNLKKFYITIFNLKYYFFKLKIRLQFSTNIFTETPKTDIKTVITIISEHKPELAQGFLSVFRVSAQ